LNSANDAHPNGLANGSDQVGRNYMFHNCKAVVSLGKEPNDTVFQKTLGINDFYFAGPDRPWPLGNIQMVGKSNAGAMKGEEPGLTLLAPRWTLTDVADHAVDWWLTTEDLPRPDNRVTVDGDGNIHLAYEATNNEEADGLYKELRTILNHVGMADHHVLSKNFYMSMNVPVAGCDSPWYPRRLQTLETRMESCQRINHAGSRPLGVTHQRRRPRLSGSCGSSELSSEPTTGPCNGSPASSATASSRCATGSTRPTSTKVGCPGPRPRMPSGSSSSSRRTAS
jgi:hypothetical protein